MAVIRLVRSPFKRLVLALSFLVLMATYVYIWRTSPRYYTSHKQNFLPNWFWNSHSGVKDKQSYIKIAGVCLPTGNEIRLMEFKEKDVEIRTRTEGSRTCCDVSVTEIKCNDNDCKMALFGNTMSLTPAAWNMALYKVLREAYVIGTDYFLISQNCSVLASGWPEKYINMLQNINPPNLGMGILSTGNYVFFHRTHFEVFGYAYPHQLNARDVYSYLYNIYPSQHRIWLDVSSGEIEPKPVKVTINAQPAITEHQITLSRHVTTKQTLGQLDNDFDVKVISMALYGSANRYLEGAIRNAQLMPVVLPGWKIRFYVPHPSLKEPIHVRPDIIKTLKRLGAEIRYVSNDVRAIIPPMMWRFLVADDTDVDIFLIQDSDSRVGSRLAAGVKEWLLKNVTFYCMRDHPWHSYSPVSGGMWGARRARLEAITHGQFVIQMANFNSSYLQDMRFLGQKIWPLVRDDAYCHDSVSCEVWPHAHPWPVPRNGFEHVGEIYNEYHVPFPSNRIKMYNTTQNLKCEPERRIYTSHV